ncbi:hypothetical protein TNCV_2578911 [Trichonephila clavipes]|nr:hypothetical protein TNCV_2578911 [Trichonephila clavipes]
MPKTNSILSTLNTTNTLSATLKIRPKKLSFLGSAKRALCVGPKPRNTLFLTQNLVQHLCAPKDQEPLFSPFTPFEGQLPSLHKDNNP